jgi:hypothetical protein
VAKYTFVCEICGEVNEKFASPQTVSGTCKGCGGNTKRQLPVMNGPVTVYENPDGQSGRKWLPDQSDIINIRKRKYYFEVEVPRMVASGTYSVETMLNEGWIWLDDNGSIHVHTTPPEMR